MRFAKTCVAIVLLASLSLPGVVAAQSADETPAENPEVTEQNDPAEPDDAEPYEPSLPEGMTVDDVLDAAAQPPPADFPRTIPDDRFYAFLLGEQLEYRAEDVDGAGELGLEWQAWAGGDFDKLWLKTDAEAVFVSETDVEAENDLLYSRLIAPFWNLQIGAQYAFGWTEQTYEDRWSTAFALEGMAPGSFEVDASMYFSEALDLTAVLSLEYDLRITQRLVLQPHGEFSFSAQEIEERGWGVGLTDMNLDARLRYEIKRGFAPYLGVRYRLLTFGTADFARDAGESPATFAVLAGLRFAI